MIGTLSGIALIAAGGVLALLYRHWAKLDAESRKKMSERRSKRLHPGKSSAAQGAEASAVHRKASTKPTFGRR
jgi:hypothetical protein